MADEQDDGTVDIDKFLRNTGYSPPRARPEVVGQVNAADPDETRRRADLQKHQFRDQRSWFQNMIRSEHGQRFLWDLLEQHGTFEERYGVTANGSHNPELTWSARGQKDLGLRLYHEWAEMDLEGVLLMHRKFGQKRNPEHMTDG